MEPPLDVTKRRGATVRGLVNRESRKPARTESARTAAGLTAARKVAGHGLAFQGGIICGYTSPLTTTRTCTMPELTSLLAFALICLGMVLTPART
jgi:prolipoprotein diacylglyceryltransferase